MESIAIRKSPKGIYLVSGFHVLIGLVLLFDLDSISLESSLWGLFSILEIALGVGLLYHVKWVRKAIIILALINSFFLALGLVLFIFEIQSGGDLIYLFTGNVIPLAINAFIVFYLLSDEARGVFGLPPRNE